MQITKETLLEKRQLAQQALDSLIAQANAQRGVIATCDNLIGILKAPESAREAPKRE